MVRVGDHDISTTDDGPHQDVALSSIHSHEKYDAYLDIHDIMIITLANDVRFNGKYNTFTISIESLIKFYLILVFFFVLCSQIAFVQFAYQSVV